MEKLNIKTAAGNMKVSNNKSDVFPGIVVQIENCEAEIYVEWNPYVKSFQVVTYKDDNDDGEVVANLQASH